MVGHCTRKIIGLKTPTCYQGLKPYSQTLPVLYCIFSREISNIIQTLSTNTDKFCYYQSEPTLYLVAGLGLFGAGSLTPRGETTIKKNK